MKIHAAPTYKNIPIIPVAVTLITLVLATPLLGAEGVWLAAAIAIFMTLSFISKQSSENAKLHFDYQALDWLLFGDVYLLERVLNIAETENRKAIVTYSGKYQNMLSAKALVLLCKRRLIEVDLAVDSEVKLDLSLTKGEGKLLIRAKDDADLKYRQEKMRRRGWGPAADQSEADGPNECLMILPQEPTIEERALKAAKGQAIIWFEDRTMATMRLTSGPQPSIGLPESALPEMLDIIAVKKYPNSDIVASIRVKNYKPEYSDEIRQIAEQEGTVAWIKGEPRDIAAWLKGRHTLDGEKLD